MIEPVTPVVAVVECQSIGAASAVSLADEDAKHERLAQCEEAITRAAPSSLLMGASLKEIRDAGLYKLTHGTFAAYCRERWRMSRIRAYQSIDEAQAVSAALSLVTILSKNDQPDGELKELRK